jgi:hypothetical protein
MNHINAVIDNFDATTDHFRQVYGAQFLCDLPNAAWQACLMAIAGAIFEFFAPHDELLHGRIGPHYLGVEYQVPDVSQARAVVQEHGMRIIRDSGVSFHTHPADGFGVAFEFYELSFHDDPPPTPYLEPLAPVSWYRDDHPLGCVGLLAYVIAVDNVDAAVTFLQDLTGASLASESHLPSTRANAVNLLLADTGVHVVAAAADVDSQRHFARHGEGIQSCVFGVRDLERAQAYFDKVGIEVQRSVDSGTLAVAAAGDRGLLLEFVESSGPPAHS